MRVAVEYQLQRMGYAVFLYREIDGQARFFQQPDGSEVESKPFTDQPDVKPTFFLEDHTAKELIEALQRVGVQPKQLTKIEGQFDAQTKHLTDLQAILRKQGVM